MRVVEIKKHGGPEVLYIGSRPVPKPNINEVLIKVKAAGINKPDILQREGEYPAPKDASDILGLEVSGEVVELGKETKNISDLTKSGSLQNFHEPIVFNLKSQRP